MNRYVNILLKTVSLAGVSYGLQSLLAVRGGMYSYAAAGIGILATFGIARNLNAGAVRQKGQEILQFYVDSNDLIENLSKGQAGFRSNVHGILLLTDNQKIIPVSEMLEMLDAGLQSEENENNDLIAKLNEFANKGDEKKTAEGLRRILCTEDDQGVFTVKQEIVDAIKNGINDNFTENHRAPLVFAQAFCNTKFHNHYTATLIAASAALGVACFTAMTRLAGIRPDVSQGASIVLGMSAVFGAMEYMDNRSFETAYEEQLKAQSNQLAI